MIAEAARGVAPAGSWWLVAGVVVAAVPVGVVLGRALATGGYRIDDELLQRLRLPTSRRWPAAAVAVLLALIWGLLAWRLGGVAGGAVLPAYLLLGWVTIPLGWVDVDVHRLPEGLTLPAVPMLAALLAVASATTGDWGALGRAVVCGVAGFLLYFLIAWFAPSMMGFGDATLAALLALAVGWLGWWWPVAAFVLAHVVAGVFVIGGLVLRRLRMTSHVAFGPFLLVGAVLALLLPVGGSAACCGG